MRIVLTGGAGYIGSHIYLELVRNGIDVIIIDNLSNSSQRVIKQLETLSNKKIEFYQYDICDFYLIDNLFSRIGKVDGIIHCAGLKSVSNSTLFPLDYYKVNVNGSLNLLSLMDKYDIDKFIFSSSASVYGDVISSPVKECYTKNPNNVYSRSKSMFEDMLQDYQKVNPDKVIAILRYFNPIGSHSSGLIGENFNSNSASLMNKILEVAVGKEDELSIFGDDYLTPDGSAVRDFIHVLDLAKGHIAALNKMDNKGFQVYNLGTGKGTSVLELVQVFEKTAKLNISLIVKNRRENDIAVSYADVSKANKELKWHAIYNLEDMCRDSWNRANKIFRNSI